ncbi:MAG: hypothetical protein IJR95_01800, partial [Lachnospiraceae bacterium]|nr:hypothetical protein [Lachnospiraceae bacterium]
KNPSRSLYSCAAVSMPPGVRPEAIPAVLLFGIFRVGMHHLIVKVPDAFLRGALLNLPQEQTDVNYYFY